MGDINAVTAILHANRRIIIQSGGVRPDELLMPGMARPRQRLADIYMDDLVMLAVLPFTQLVSLQRARELGNAAGTNVNFPDPLTDVRAVDAHWARPGLPQAEAKR